MVELWDCVKHSELKIVLKIKEEKKNRELTLDNKFVIVKEEETCSK